jgi:tRNA pseudouridine(38-40) synthase
MMMNNNFLNSNSTDQGVHSFFNLAHVDLELLKNGTAIPPYQLQKTLNVFCDKSDINITVNSVEAVPPAFHARHSSYSRHYLYRIGVTPEAVKYHPVVEWRKCYFIEKPFCLDRATEACKLFDGTKDFASFCHGLNQRPQGYPTVRTLETFHIKPGRPLFDPVYDPLYSGIDFYDFHIKARSFMYKQVRRMVSVVVAVAKGRMNLEEVHQLFDNPGQWNSKASTAPPYGLYLLNVDYKIPQDEQPQRTIEN